MNSNLHTFLLELCSIVGLVFKNVEVVPYFFNRIMDGTVCTTAFRAEKFRSILKSIQIKNNEPIQNGLTLQKA